MSGLFSIFFTIWIFYWLFFTSLTFSQSCHPECENDCNTSIICPAVCIAITKPADCQIVCVPSSYVLYVGQCEFSCYQFYNTSLGQCELSGCPVVETKCSPLTCVNIPFNVACQIECQAPQSSWLCTSPIPSTTNDKCRYTITPPDCASSWSCDSPACEFVSHASSITNAPLIIKYGLILTVLLMPVSIKHWFYVGCLVSSRSNSKHN